MKIEADGEDRWLGTHETSDSVWTYTILKTATGFSYHSEPMNDLNCFFLFEGTDMEEGMRQAIEHERLIVVASH